MTVRQLAIGNAEYAAALELRERVLRKPLGLTLTAAEHAQEPDCFHIGGFEGERLIAVLLLQPMSARTVKMRQVAVDPEFQSRGIGTRLVRFAEDRARERIRRNHRARARHRGPFLPAPRLHRLRRGIHRSDNSAPEGDDLWTTVNLTSPLKKPRQDLKPRLVAAPQKALRQKPGANIIEAIDRLFE